MYYADKIQSLKDIFGTNDLRFEKDNLIVGGHTYPIVDDVVVLLDPRQYPNTLKKRLNYPEHKAIEASSVFAEDIQYTFGDEWMRFSKILPDYEQEFLRYFDIVNLEDLKNARVCDLGCGSGRWSYFLSNKCRELILVDFSEAIFVARRNLANANNALFFMGDIRKLPFREEFADFLFCLGVLHHLPVPALDEVRALKNYAPWQLIYLYYNLDNRPIYFRLILSFVSKIRSMASRVRNPAFRQVFSWGVTILICLPLLLIGKALRPLGLSRHVPIYDAYHNKSLHLIYQDMYDRFFTRIEQRFSRAQLMELKDTFSTIVISDRVPYWHFVCRK